MKAEKKELQAKFHRDLIADTAEQLFVTKGYEKTLMDEIAKVAGTAKPLCMSTSKIRMKFLIISFFEELIH